MIFSINETIQVLQKEQQQEISQLEKKLTEMRMKHNEAVQKLKAKFLEDKNTFEEESETQLKELSKEAKKVSLPNSSELSYCFWLMRNRN